MWPFFMSCEFQLSLLHDQFIVFKTIFKSNETNQEVGRDSYDVSNKRAFCGIAFSTRAKEKLVLEF